MVVVIDEGLPLQHVQITGCCLMPLHELSLYCSTEAKKSTWRRSEISHGSSLMGSTIWLFCPLSFRILSVQPQQPPEQFCHVQSTSFAPVSSCICILHLCLQPAYDPPNVEGLSYVCRFCSGVFRKWNEMQLHFCCLDYVLISETYSSFSPKYFFTGEN